MSSCRHDPLPLIFSRIYNIFGVANHLWPIFSSVVNIELSNIPSQFDKALRMSTLDLLCIGYTVVVPFDRASPQGAFAESSPSSTGMISRIRTSRLPEDAVLRTYMIHVLKLAQGSRWRPRRTRHPVLTPQILPNMGSPLGCVLHTPLRVWLPC